MIGKSMSPFGSVLCSPMSRATKSMQSHRRFGFSRSIAVLIGLVSILFTAGRASGVTKTWDGGAGTLNWDQANNWNPNGIPNATDDVVLDVPGTITVTMYSFNASIRSLICTENLTLFSANLSISVPSSISGVLTLTSGHIVGSGDLTISGILNSYGSSQISGTGAKLIIAPSGVANLSHSMSVGRIFENFGTVNSNEGFSLDSGVQFVNKASGELYWRGGAVSAWSGFVNDGTLFLDAANPSSTLTVIGTLIHNGALVFLNPASVLDAWVLENHSLIDIPAGGRLIGRNLLNHGVVNIGAGAELQVWTGMTNAVDGTIAGPGNLGFVPGAASSVSTFTFDSDVLFTGEVRFYQGITQIVGNFTPTGPVVIYQFATYRENGNRTWSNTFTLNLGGVIDGTGDVTFTGTMIWNGGAMYGPGRTIVAPTATMQMTNNDQRNFFRELNVHGAAILTGGQLSGSSLSSITNHGQIVIGESGTLNQYGGFTQTSNGTLNIAMGASVASHVNFFGNLNLAGALQASATPTPVAATTYTLLSCSGTRTGAFESINLSPNGSLIYNPANVQWQAYRIGDVNGDNLVNVSDLLSIINAWGACTSVPPNSGTCPADVAPPGGNGAVNVADLLQVINNWG